MSTSYGISFLEFVFHPPAMYNMFVNFLRNLNFNMFVNYMMNTTIIVDLLSPPNGASGPTNA
jgi:hypothetical protein